MEKCKQTTGGIKSIHIMEVPLDLNKINFMSELNSNEANEVKERIGIDCVILSPSFNKLVKDIKYLIALAEREAEEYYQEINNQSEGDKALAKVEAYKDIIKIITGNKPILNND